jgi:hypothetical protein
LGLERWTSPYQIIENDLLGVGSLDEDFGTMAMSVSPRVSLERSGKQGVAVTSSQLQIQF